MKSISNNSNSKNLIRINVLAFILSGIFFIMLFFVPILESSKPPLVPENPGGEIVDPEFPVEPETPVDPSMPVIKPPKFKTSISAYNYLFEQAYSKSFTINASQSIDAYAFGILQTKQTVKVNTKFESKTDYELTSSSFLNEGYSIGKEFYEIIKSDGENVLFKHTDNLNDKHEPIWSNEAVLMLKNDYIKMRGSMPYESTFLINQNTIITQSQITYSANEGMFTFVLKSSATEKHKIQINNVSGSSKFPVINDGGIKLTITFNSFNGNIKKITREEEYQVSLFGINAICKVKAVENFKF